MLIDNEDIAALEGDRLAKALVQVIGTQRLTEGSLKHAREIVKRHRKECRAKGLDFPEMTVIPLYQHQVVEVYRADLAEADIITVIRNISVKYPRMGSAEIAKGIGIGYPQYARVMSNFSFQRKREARGMILN